MATTKTAAQKSAETDSLENKSLEAAAAEHKAEGVTADPVTATLEEEPPEPNRQGNVRVVVAHPLRAGLVKEGPVKPGDEASVKAALAKELVAAGAAAYAAK